jgi:hypothetical protein
MEVAGIDISMCCSPYPQGIKKKMTTTGLWMIEKQRAQFLQNSSGSGVGRCSTDFRSALIFMRNLKYESRSQTLLEEHLKFLWWTAGTLNVELACQQCRGILILQSVRNGLIHCRLSGGQESWAIGAWIFQTYKVPMQLVAAVYFLHTCRLLLKGKANNGSLLIFSVMHRKVFQCIRANLHAK